MTIQERQAILAQAKKLIRDRSQELETRDLKRAETESLFICEEDKIFKMIPLLKPNELEYGLKLMIHSIFIGKHIDLDVLCAKVVKKLGRELTKRELKDIEIRKQYNELSTKSIKLLAAVEKDESRRPEFDAMSTDLEALSQPMSRPGIII
jgi:hypothetical protein